MSSPRILNSPRILKNKFVDIEDFSISVYLYQIHLIVLACCEGSLFLAQNTDLVIYVEC